MLIKHHGYTNDSSVILNSVCFEGAFILPYLYALRQRKFFAFFDFELPSISSFHSKSSSGSSIIYTTKSSLNNTFAYDAI